MKAFKSLAKQDNLLTDFKYICSPSYSILHKPWYNGRWEENGTPFRMSNGRFSLRKKPVCYLVTDLSIRMNYEINRCFEIEKKNNQSIGFEKAQRNFKENDFPFSKTFYLDYKNISLFNFVASSTVDRLAQVTDADKDFYSSLIEHRSNEIYDLSIQFAKIIYDKGFDGIIYQSCTVLASDWLGPQNDPMILLFNRDRCFDQPIDWGLIKKRKFA